jgi:hypothetical protein
MQLSQYVKITEMGYSSSGITVVADCANAEGALFLGVPATTGAKLWQLTLSGGATTAALVACSTASALESTAAARNAMCIDVYKPKHRYVSATFSASADQECRLFAFTYGLRTPGGTTWAPTVIGAAGLSYSAANGLIKRVISPTSTGTG